MFFLFFLFLVLFICQDLLFHQFFFFFWLHLSTKSWYSLLVEDHKEQSIWWDIQISIFHNSHSVQLKNNQWSSNVQWKKNKCLCVDLQANHFFKIFFFFWNYFMNFFFFWCFGKLEKRCGEVKFDDFVFFFFFHFWFFKMNQKWSNSLFFFSLFFFFFFFDLKDWMVLMMFFCESISIIVSFFCFGFLYLSKKNHWKQIIILKKLKVFLFFFFQTFFHFCSIIRFDFDFDWKEREGKGFILFWEKKKKRIPFHSKREKRKRKMILSN